MADCPPVGATPAHDPECESRQEVHHFGGETYCANCGGKVSTQPQPTDAIRELAENLRISGREWVHAATIADNIIGVLDGFEAGFGSGPDFVGAVAEIRALHRKDFHGLICVHCSEFCDGRRYTSWPCPTIAALDRAGCP